MYEGLESHGRIQVCCSKYHTNLMKKVNIWELLIILGVIVMKRIKLKMFDVPIYVKIYPIVFLLFYLAMGIVAPVQIIFFRHIGLSLFQIGLVATILEISIAIFEVPTGYIADKFGRDISVACSFICFVIAGILYLNIKNIYGVSIATFIQGIGYTCISGAFEAWGVDKLISNKQEKYTEKLMITATQSKRIGFLIGSVVGGYFGLKFINIVWKLYVVINSICLIIVCLFMNEVKLDINHNKEKEERGSLLSKFFLLDSKMIISFVIILGVIGILHEFSISPVDEYWTVFFTENLKIPDFWLGWIIASGNILVIFFVSPIVKFLTVKFDYINALKIITICIILCISILCASGNAFLIIGFYVAFKFNLGIYEPIQQTYINSIIKGEFRATILSIYSMLGAIGEIVSGVTIGAIAEAISIRVAFGVSAIGFFVIVVLFRILNSINVTSLNRTVVKY